MVVQLPEQHPAIPAQGTSRANLGRQTDCQMYGVKLSFHFGLLGFRFLSFWPFGPSFPFILAFWAFTCFLFAFLEVKFSKIPLQWGVVILKSFCFCFMLTPPWPKLGRQPL